MTIKEQQGFFGLLLMLFLFLLRALRDFLRRPFRLSLKAQRLGPSNQPKHQGSDESVRINVSLDVPTDDTPPK